jgi:hypothetical protein
VCGGGGKIGGGSVDGVGIGQGWVVDMVREVESTREGSMDLKTCDKMEYRKKELAL